MNFQKVCRVCLSENPGMVSIFDSYKFYECYLEICEVITNCASVQINKLDGFSEQICKTCLGDLWRAHRFKQLCEESDYKFRNNLIVTDKINGTFPEEDTKIQYSEVTEINKILKVSLDGGTSKIKSEFIEEDQFHEGNITKSSTNNIEFIEFPGSSLKTEPTMLPKEDIKVELCEINCDNEDDNTSSHDGFSKIRNENQFNEEQTSPPKTELTIIPDEKSYNCEFCSKSFNNSKSLNNHINIHTGEKPYECDICNKCYSLKAVLNRHKETHSGVKSYKCEICDKYFGQKGVLIRHRKIHTGDKPYKCEVCDKCFNAKANLNIHKSIHTGDKPFNCDICCKSFRCQSALYSHNKQHMRERPFKCEMCDKSFKEKAKLNNHIRIHTGERPYKCDVCFKCFTQKKTLVDHKKIHTAEKSYKCNFCSKGFNQKSNLNTHMRIHTGDKPYKCEICSQYFRHHTALIRHNKIHREEIP